MPYTKKYRLTDVMVLIQVLGMYKETYRSEEPLQKNFKGLRAQQKLGLKLVERVQNFFGFANKGNGSFSYCSSCSGR